MENAPEIGAMIPTPDREPAFTRFSSPPLIETGKRVFFAEPQYSDLDVNGHVNNTRYADWLCDALGTETLEKHPLERFVIHYDSEIRPGQPVELRLQRADLKFRMIGIHDGRTAFSVGGTLMDSAG